MPAYGTTYINFEHGGLQQVGLYTGANHELIKQYLCAMVNAIDLFWSTGLLSVGGLGHLWLRKRLSPHRLQAITSTRTNLTLKYRDGWYLMEISSKWKKVLIQENAPTIAVSIPYLQC